MAKVRSPFEQPRRVPWLGDRLVEPGAVVAVPDEQLAHYLEGGWIPADGPTKAKGRKLLAAGTVTVLAGETDAGDQDDAGDGDKGDQGAGGAE